MCIQKIGSIYVSNLKYNCNSLTANIQGVTHNLDKLISFTESSCIVSNSISTFELYTPTINIDEIKKCFSCKEIVKLDNIEDLKGLGSIINSFNSNSNNSNSTVGNSNSLNSCCTELSIVTEREKKEIQRKELEIKEQLDRIEKEVYVRNYAESTFIPLIIVICLILVCVILIVVKML